MSFRTSPNKNTIRRDWDAPILRQYMAAVGHRLRYFGMTGPEMHDVLTWRDMLFDWTSIEEAPKSPRNFVWPTAPQNKFCKQRLTMVLPIALKCFAAASKMSFVMELMSLAHEYVTL